MDYVRVTISTTGEGIEAVAGALSAIGLDQIEMIEDEAAIQGYLDQMAAQWDYVDPGELLQGTEPGVRVYIPLEDIKKMGQDTVQEIRERMQWLREQDLGVELGALSVTTEIVREQDWANNWKQYYKPTRIGQRVVIKPSWEEYEPKEDDCVIEMDPGMAFGTGTHETTALCLEAIERHVKVGGRMLDIGCGSGILSIAACLLGAGQADAIDIDTVAVRVAQENVELNGLTEKITCRQGDLLQGNYGVADLTVANIVADVILRLLPAAYAHTKPGGVFIASGIIDEREEEIADAAVKAGFTPLEALARGSWRALVYARK